MPFVEVLEMYFLRFRRSCLFLCAFEFPDMLNELQIIDIAFVPPCLDRFNVAATVPVKLVNKRERLAGPSVFFRPHTRCPFVPTCNKNSLRIQFIGTTPLFFKIRAIEIAVIALVKTILISV